MVYFPVSKVSYNTIKNINAFFEIDILIYKRNIKRNLMYKLNNDIN